MNKFGLLDDEPGPAAGTSLSERLASFPPIAPRVPVDLAAMDAAAAPHGFSSREVAAPAPATAEAGRRRRRTLTTEPTRHLAIRLTLSQYDRFVAYADRHRLTYQEALEKLMDEAGGFL